MLYMRLCYHTVTFLVTVQLLSVVIHCSTTDFLSGHPPLRSTGVQASHCGPHTGSLWWGNHQMYHCPGGVLQDGLPKHEEGENRELAVDVMSSTLAISESQKYAVVNHLE